MPQPLLIFRKDMRHLWPETLVVLLLFVAFAWSAPSGWSTSVYATFAPILSGFLKLLMPIAWLVLISRLVHDEPLVGDRQFWTSRPYHWGSLLLAKLLYLAVFLYLPFLLMQVFLLWRAGLHPLLSLPALGKNLLLLTVIVVVPLMALAAVTATFARLLLSALGALLYVAILGILFAFLAFERMPPPALSPVLFAIFILLPAAALVYQYRTRRTAAARIALAATPLLIVALLFVTPAAALIRHAFPLDTGSTRLSAPPSEIAQQQPGTGRLLTFRDRAALSLPFSIAGVDKDSNYVIHGAALQVDGPGGARYAGPYVTAPGQFGAGQAVGVVNLPVPLATLNAGKDQPVAVHLSIAAEHIRALPPATWKASGPVFDVPGKGVCAFPSEAQLNSNPEAGPLCRYPFQTPKLNLVEAPIAFGPCGNGTTVDGFAALGGQPGVLDFDPVVTAPLNLQPRQQAPPGTSFTLCPGTPLRFTEAKSEGRVRFEVDAGKLVLDAFAARQKPVEVPTDLPRVPQKP